MISGQGQDQLFVLLKEDGKAKTQNTVNACLSFTCYIEEETNLHCKAWLSDLKYLKQKKVYKWVALCLQFCSAQTRHQDLLSQQFPYMKQKKWKKCKVFLQLIFKRQNYIFLPSLEKFTLHHFSIPTPKRFACFCKITIQMSFVHAEGWTHQEVLLSPWMWCPESASSTLGIQAPVYKGRNPWWKLFTNGVKQKWGLKEKLWNGWCRVSGQARTDGTLPGAQLALLHHRGASSAAFQGSTVLKSKTRETFLTTSAL